MGHTGAENEGTGHHFASRARCDHFPPVLAYVQEHVSRHYGTRMCDNHTSQSKFIHKFQLCQSAVMGTHRNTAQHLRRGKLGVSCLCLAVQYCRCGVFMVELSGGTKTSKAILRQP